MSASAHKAVFLSYASGDAEAARRICESLRAAGIEVWFDQSELVGGDQWDAKIRKQIAECALFMPVISAETQARREGYFRIEWRLAAQRTHAMSDDTPFLLPVVIDETRDAEARVPAEFKALQWTRLRQTYGGQDRDQASVTAFCARVQRLLRDAGDPSISNGSEGAESRRTPAATDQRREADKASGPRPALRWAVVALAVVVGSVGIFFGLRHPAIVPVRSELRDDAVTRALSDSKQNVAKGWQTLDSVPEPVRAELDGASEYYLRAVALDSTNAEAWALGSQIDTWYVAKDIDNSASRREAARTKAAKALSLSPHSYDARLADAVYLVRGEGFDTPSSFAAEAEQSLRQLLREKPDEPHALLALGHLLRNSKRVDEASQLFDQLARNPAWTAAATNAKAWMMFRVGRCDEAVEIVASSVAARPFHGNVRLQGYLAMDWQGDLELARSALEKLPAAELREDSGVYFAVNVFWYRREPAQMLRVLNAAPHEWVSSLSFTGPRDYWVGVAQQMAGNREAANVAWQAGLQLVENKLAASGSSADLLVLKGQLLVRLGERAAAEKAFSLAGHLGWKGWAALELSDAEAVWAEPGRAAWFPWARLHLDPSLDFLRGDPRFEAYVTAAENDPKRAPRKKGVAQPAVKEGKYILEEKSVAVLAFANLSDDKANEYFSDGISEELLNVLAKIPGLKVSARTSAFYFKGKDTPIPEIAQRLGVAYVVEGSVRRQGTQVRITAQLIKASDGFHVWSETFTRELKDVFAVQDEIAGLVAKNLSLKLGAGGSSSAGFGNAEAFELYLQARAAWRLRTEESVRQAELLIRRAIELEPGFARAHAVLADVLVVRRQVKSSVFGGRQSAECLEIIEIARRAVSLDPQLSEAHAALGGALRNAWRIDEAEAALRRAVALNPSDATAWQWLGRVLLTEGRIEEALETLRRATELDPLSARIHDNYCICLLDAGRLREALKACDRALSLQPDSSQALALKGTLLAEMGDSSAARSIAQALSAVTGSVEVQFAAYILARIGAAEEAKSLLSNLRTSPAKIGAQLLLGQEPELFAELIPDEMSVQPMDFLYFWPVFDPIRGDPRFMKLLETLGVAEAHARAQVWRAAHPPETRGTKS